MKKLLWPLAVLIVPAILGAAGFFLAHTAPSAPTSPDTAATLSPAATRTPAPASTASASPRATTASRPHARHRRHHAGPWAVVSTYYRDVSSHRYAKAWALISPALATRQTYEQFVAGYACMSTERPTRLSQSGHQVSFNLAVVNRCTAATQNYTGTDTVRGGKIVAAEVTLTG